MPLFVASLLVTLAVQIQASLIVFTPPILAPDAQQDIGVSAAAVGLVTALIYLASVPSALISGLLVSRIGAIRVSQLCVLFASTGIILISTGDPLIIVIGALVVGIGYGAVTPSSSTVLADQAPKNVRSLIFSIKQSGVPIGGAIAGTLVPFLMYRFGWREAAIITGLIGFFVIVLAQLIQKKIDRPTLRSPELAQSLSLIKPIKFVFADRKLRELAVSSFAFSGMQMSLGSYLVVMLTEQAQLTVAVAGYALSVAMIAGVIGRLFWGGLADYGISPRRVLGFLGFLMGLSASAICFVNSEFSITLVYVLAFFFGASAVGWNGVYIAEVARIAPTGQTGMATGGSLAMTYSGVVLLPTSFWLIYLITNSYIWGFLALGLLTFWRGLLFFKRP
ncbi:MAG: MFS transporter [Betaproteobacteria bacterium]|nr:MFS transporter [Betaproteobacteria bacterium]MDA9295764.1 MFS transporter [Burkholderiales bacterium]MDC1433422.1 MFS transporter [Burkholderiales bacterium]